MAFNIDVEVAQASNRTIKIYCASLTDTWETERSTKELKDFYTALTKHETIKQSKIALGEFPKLSEQGACELFLSRLGCNTTVLRIPLFHDFLNIPNSVRDGLTYASHKPFGKSAREGHMQKHPRFVRHGGGKRWIRLTKDERGGSLICYKDENKASVVSTIKIGASTAVQNLKDQGIPNAFVIKSGKRQWILQASSARDYQHWQIPIDKILKQFGHQVTGGLVGLDEKQSEDGEPAMNPQMEKLKKQNLELKNEVEMLQGKIDGMSAELRRLKSVHDEAGSGNLLMAKKVQNEFRLEKDALIRDYELQSQNLEHELAELRRQIDAKTAMDTQQGKKGLMNGFTLGSPETLTSEIDAEKRILDGFTEEERAAIKFAHKHLHKQTHKHVHTHKHIHLHKDEADNVDSVVVEDMELVNKHTVSHTITHSNTQIRVTKNFI